MQKKKINLIGGGFSHCLSTNAHILPKKIEWVLDKSSNISIHVDSGIWLEPDRSKRNFAFLAESKTIISDVYRMVVENLEFLEEKYEYIFTHDISLLSKSNKIKYVNPPCTSWILENNRKLYKKSKLISMISSTKQMCDAHILRNKVADKYGSELDLYGRGREKKLDNKLDGLKDYCFSIAIENGIYDDMYTEKILDCFTTGTIPVYYGSRCVNNIFNEDGIFWLEKIQLQDLTFDLYYEKLEAIRENLIIAASLPLPEDYIYENYIGT